MKIKRTSLIIFIALIIATVGFCWIYAVTLGGNLSAGGYRVVSVGTPTGDTDGATKGYVDAASGSYGYSSCYVACANTVTCHNGYTKIVTSAGNSCGGFSGAHPNDSLITVGGQVARLKYNTSANDCLCKSAENYRTYECISLQAPYASVNCGMFAYKQCRYSVNYYPSECALCCIQE